MEHLSLPEFDVFGREDFLSEELLCRLIKHSVQQKGVLHRRLNLLRIINVYGCLEGESLRVDELLGAMVFEEVEVVR